WQPERRVETRVRRVPERGRRRPSLPERLCSRPGRGVRSREPRQPARSREPAEAERPRDLPDPQLHGRGPPAARAPGRHGDSDGEAARASRMNLPHDPIFLSTAIEAVVRAGTIQMERFGRDIRVDKKGTIDLVTEVDVAIERMFRDLVAERFT